MIFFTLFFLLGDIYLQTFNELPTLTTILFIFVINLVLYLLLYKHIRFLHLGFAFTLGFVFSAWYANSLLAWTLPKELEGQALSAQGYIASIPSEDQLGKHFVFSISQLHDKNLLIHKNIRVHLTWRENNLQLHVGDQWKLLISLKRIHNTQNPGQFDFEAWALEQQLRATGKVLINPSNQLLQHNNYFQPIDQLRQHLQLRVKHYASSLTNTTWLLALMIGERSGATKYEWEILRDTGTNHLMAIAGLHIGLIVIIVNQCIMFLWKYFPTLALRVPTRHAGAIAALIVAWLYSALAGFSLPTQRACIMLTLYIIMCLSRRQINSWYVWSLALLIILCLNPLTVLTESFWLSFSTIAFIIFGMQGRLAPCGYWWRWGRVQWIITLGLIPLAQFLFHECSLIAFVANCIAIPWLAIIILPCCFLSSLLIFFLPSIGEIIIKFTDYNLSGLWLVLAKLSHSHLAVWHQPIVNYLVAVISILACIILLIPAGLPGRLLSIVWFLPMLTCKSPEIRAGQVAISVLDVGQGLSVFVQTTHHTLLYDTGAKYATGLDMGEAVVVPYLQTIAVKHLDKIVISHGDNDHIGGLAAVTKNIEVSEVLSSVPEKIQFNNKNFCLAGQQWQWDGVKFAFIYPTKENLDLNNDSSCVLTIDNGVHKILLTGDIEKYAERYLLKNNFSDLSAEILVAPHHGSKTSGLKSFIKAVHPKIVLYATGYRNRYHFPHISVVANYSEMKSTQLNTASTGLIQFFIDKNEEIVKPFLYRIDHKRYWYD